MFLIFRLFHNFTNFTEDQTKLYNKLVTKKFKQAKTSVLINSENNCRLV